MAQHDPPWRLDPLKNIVNVGWGGSIIVLVFQWTVSGSTTDSPSAASWDVVFTNDTDMAALSGRSLLQQIGPAVSPPGPPKTSPPSESIPGNNDFWSYPPENTSETVDNSVTVHVIDVGKYGIFTNAGAITFHEDPLFGVQVPFIIDTTRSGLFNEGGFDIYGTMDNPSVQAILDAQIRAIAFNEFEPDPTFIQPYLLEELSGHDETQVRTTLTREGESAAFLNPGRIAARDPVIKAAKKLKLVLLVSPLGSRTFMEWRLVSATYLGGVARKFTILDDPPVIQPDPDRAPIGFNVIEGERAPERPAPAVKITLTIDLKTYQITSSKQEL